MASRKSVQNRNHQPRAVSIALAQARGGREDRLSTLPGGEGGGKSLALRHGRRNSLAALTADGDNRDTLPTARASRNGDCETMENSVTFRSVIGLLVVWSLASSAEAQETRTFPDAQCTYTLPDKTWEWLDPQLAPKVIGKCLLLTRNQNGLVALLSFTPLEKGQKPDDRAFDQFEAGYLKDGKLKKLGGKDSTFRGIHSYQ